MNTVYVHVRHWLFWYGVYGFCGKSRNDEITLYSDKEQNHLLGYFELLTHPLLRHLTKHELDPIDDKKYIDEINGFLEGSQEVDYSYLYPRDEEDESHQVKHRAPKNEKGHKPIYINVWSKRSKDWDESSIEEITKIIAQEFLSLNVDAIAFIDRPTYEETKMNYQQYYEPYIQ